MYWDSSNEFAPHGNDTGADVLEEYRKWRRRDSTGDPLAFLRRLMKRWGVAAQVDDDEHTVMDEAAVALAFAEFKLLARCSSAVLDIARSAILRQRQQAEDAIDWPHRTERLRVLILLEHMLADAGSPR